MNPDIANCKDNYSFTRLVRPHQKSEWLLGHFSSQTKEEIVLMLVSVGTSIYNLVQSQTEDVEVSTANYFLQILVMMYEMEYTYIVQYSPRIHSKSLSYGNNSVRSAAVICG